MGLIFWLLSQLVVAAVAPLSNISCLDQIVTVVEAAGESTQWLRFPGGVASRLGTGSVAVYPDGAKTQLLLVTEKTTTGLAFEAPGCSSQLLFSRATTPSFRDIDLAELMKQNTKGLIYVWSPQMELSVKEVSELKDYKLDYPVSVAMDAEGDALVAEKIKKDKRLPEEYLRRVNSSALFSADVALHYPAVIFYKNGKILQRLPGYNGRNLKQIAKKILK